MINDEQVRNDPDHDEPVKTEAKTETETNPQNLNTLIERMVFLKKTPLFSELSIAELGLIAKITSNENYPDETILIEEGRRNQKLFIVAQGHVELSANLTEGQHGSVGIVSAPGCLGEDGIFNDSPSPVCAQVIMGPAVMITLDGDDLKRLIRLYPEIGIGLLASLSNRLQRLERTMIKFEK